MQMNIPFLSAIIAIYVVGFIAAFMLSAWLDGQSSVEGAVVSSFFCGILWPLTLVVIVVAVACEALVEVYERTFAISRSRRLKKVERNGQH